MAGCVLFPSDAGEQSTPILPPNRCVPNVAARLRTGWLLVTIARRAGESGCFCSPAPSNSARKIIWHSQSTFSIAPDRRYNNCLRLRHISAGGVTKRFLKGRSAKRDPSRYGNGSVCCGRYHNGGERAGIERFSPEGLSIGCG